MGDGMGMCMGMCMGMVVHTRVAQGVVSWLAANEDQKNL